MKNMETWKREFSTVAAQIYHELQIIYLQERSCLLQCILTLLRNPPNTKDVPGAFDFIKELL